MGVENRRKKNVCREFQAEETLQGDKEIDFFSSEATHVWLLRHPGVMVSMVSNHLVAKVASVLIKQPFKLLASVVLIKQPVEQIRVVAHLREKKLKKINHTTLQQHHENFTALPQLRLRGPSYTHCTTDIWSVWLLLDSINM